MTEFLIFLVLCAVFGTGFWLFLKKIPTPEQHMKDRVAAELAKDREKVLKEDSAARSEPVAQTSRGFGRKNAETNSTFVLPEHAFPLAQYDGAAPENPFGYDLKNPTAKTIPPNFLGTWFRMNQRGARTQIVLEAARLLHLEAVGWEPVVAVYRGEEFSSADSEDEIAVVSQSMENGRWAYSLMYFGLSESGAKLTNIESMDMTWRKTDASNN